MGWWEDFVNNIANTHVNMQGGSTNHTLGDYWSNPGALIGDLFGSGVASQALSNAQASGPRPAPSFDNGSSYNPGMTGNTNALVSGPSGSSLSSSNLTPSQTFSTPIGSVNRSYTPYTAPQGSVTPMDQPTSPQTTTPAGATQPTATGQPDGKNDMMPWLLGLSGLVNAGVSIWNGNQQAQAISDATKANTSTASEANALQRQMWEQQQANLKPWLDAGAGALTQIQNFDDSPFKFDQTDPSYQFRLKEGLKATQNAAAARGGLLSGSTFKALDNYAQDAASQEYQNAFNRYWAEKNAKLNRLQSLAGIGQTAVNQIGQVGQNYANNVNNTNINNTNALVQGRIAAANSTASGYANGMNNLNNALSNYIGYNQGQEYLKRLPLPVK